ncbi:testis-expressed protein 9-like [Lineus longissimus]|uniref:testis-expressed protein 9-like n=1 Tax=Lineus longissimus TaxID=88925 RepID=UPI002B4F6A89
MAEQSNFGRNSQSRGGRPATGGRKSATNIRNNLEPSNDLLRKEEEYKRLNAELEAKTASLLNEAEEVMKGQESALSRPSLLDNINADDFLRNWEDEESLSNKSDEDQGQESRPPTQRSTRPPSKVSNHSRPTTAARPISAKARPSSRTQSKKTKSNLADDVAVPDDAFVTEFRDYSLKKTISNIEGKLDKGEFDPRELEDDDVLPSAAKDMGTEAQIRFLKAKLRVMQEEVDRLAHECGKKDEENSSLLVKLKDAEDERLRFSRTASQQQGQIEKYKKLSEESKAKADLLENQLNSNKKDLESLKRSQKQQVSSQGATEVRLNRALEEVEKYKQQMTRFKSSTKDTSELDKRKIEQLLAENKRLDKQKNELMTGFKKQLKLIDILKRQKMHIEAAKMLQFSEEEFVKALEWGN